MMSNFRGKARSRDCAIAVACACTVLFFPACVAQPTVSDAPAAALPGTETLRVSVDELPRADDRLQIRHATARLVSSDDATFARFVHPEGFDRLEEPLLISVETTTPFTVQDLAKTRSPIIVLNGEPLTDSVVAGTDLTTVHAVVDASRARRPLRLQVGWLGALSETISDSIEIGIGPK